MPDMVIDIASSRTSEKRGETRHAHRERDVEAGLRTPLENFAPDFQIGKNLSKGSVRPVEVLTSESPERAKVFVQHELRARQQDACEAGRAIPGMVFCSDITVICEL